MIYTHKEITQRDLNAIILANKNIIKNLDNVSTGFAGLGILNQTIFKFLTQKQIDYIVEKVEN